MTSRFATIFATVVIGGIAAYIAWRQYEVAHAKLKLDLFDKRFAIFQQTWEIFSEVVSKDTRARNWGLATPFNNYAPSAAFLFGKQIAQYLDEARANWIDLHALEGEVGGEGIDHTEAIRLLRNWFEEEAQRGVKAKLRHILILRSGSRTPSLKDTLHS